MAPASERVSRPLLGVRPSVLPLGGGGGGPSRPRPMRAVLGAPRAVPVLRPQHRLPLAGLLPPPRQGAQPRRFQKEGGLSHQMEGGRADVILFFVILFYFILSHFGKRQSDFCFWKSVLKQSKETRCF